MNEGQQPTAAIADNIDIISLSSDEEEGEGLKQSSRCKSTESTGMNKEVVDNAKPEETLKDVPSSGKGSVVLCPFYL